MEKEFTMGDKPELIEALVYLPDIGYFLAGA
jgi:hypothetical protein